MPNAHLEVSDISNPRAHITRQNLVFNGVDDFGPGFDLWIPNDERANPISFTVTWTNLSGAAYQGKPITKIVSHFSIENIKGIDWIYFQATDNPYYGFTFSGKLTRTTSFFYANGANVNFAPGTAYLAVASLNNYTNNLKDYSIESDTVLAGGTAKSLYKSSVAAHGNSLYSDLANSSDNEGHYLATGSREVSDSDKWELNPAAHTDNNIIFDWDKMDSPNRYYGAGLIELNGDSLKDLIWAKNDGIPQGAKHRGYMWYNQSTVIPPSPSTTVNYHYNVA